MSFCCEICLEAQPSGTRPIQVVTATRPRTYRNQHSETHGWEIVRLKLACEPCSVKTEDVGEKLRAEFHAHLGELGEETKKGLTQAVLAMQYGTPPVKAPQAVYGPEDRIV